MMKNLFVTLTLILWTMYAFGQSKPAEKGMVEFWSDQSTKHLNKETANLKMSRDGNFRYAHPLGTLFFAGGTMERGDQLTVHQNINSK